MLALALCAAAAQAETERYQMDDAEAAALATAADAALGVDGEIHRTRTLIEGPRITARVDYLPHDRANEVSAYRRVRCEKRGYDGDWNCAPPVVEHEIDVEGDTLRLGAGIEIAEGFELARSVHVLHLTDPEVSQHEDALKGTVGKSELRDIVRIDRDGGRYRVALAGQPLRHNVLELTRVRCGGFATCGIELTGVSQGRYFDLPRAFPRRPPSSPVP